MHTAFKFCYLFVSAVVFVISCGTEEPTYSVEEIDGVKYIQNQTTKWGDEPKLELELVRQIGDLETEDENYQLHRPVDVALDKEGNILVLDEGNHRVQKYSPEGEFISSFGKKGQGPGELSSPIAMSVDQGGSIYIVDPSIQGYHIFDEQGDFVEVVKLNNFLQQIIPLVDGTLITQTLSFSQSELGKEKTLFKIMSKKGDTQKSFGEKREYADMMMKVQGNFAALTSDKMGNIFTTFAMQNRIEKYSPSGDLVLQIKRDLPYQESEIVETKQFEMPDGTKQPGPNFVFFSFSIQVDNKDRIWVNTLKKQINIFQLNADTPPEEPYLTFEIYDKNGGLLGHVTNPMTNPRSGFKIFGDRVFITDMIQEMAVYEYKIVER